MNMNSLRNGGNPFTPKEGREQAPEKYPTFSLRLERESRNGNALLYGTLLGVYHEPSNGIQILFEGAHCAGWGSWRFGVWLVSLTGANLEKAYHYLCESKLEFVQEGGESGIVIKVEPFVLPGYNDKPEK